VLAAIPVGLPATFTLAAAIGARSLAKEGVLPTRLSAVGEAATIDVLCADKTETLTLNQLSVETVSPASTVSGAYVLGLQHWRHLKAVRIPSTPLYVPHLTRSQC
jgi:H+-transporting ATPase